MSSFAPFASLTSLASSLTRNRSQRPRARARLPWSLFLAALLDEWTTGFLVVALPQLRDAVGLSYEQIGLLFTFGALTSLFFDPILNALSDRFPKHLPMLVGTLVLVACYALVGFANTFALLALGFALLRPAATTAVDLAQLSLIDLRPSASARIMARWTLLSGVGDLLAPLTVALFLAIHWGWTALCLLAAGLWFGSTLVNWRRTFASEASANATRDEPAEPSEAANDADDDGEAVPLQAALRDALRDRRLLRWTLIVTVASMLDEIFLGFAALYLRDRLHVPVGLVSLALLANLGGSMLGLVLLDRVLARFGQRFGVRLLPWYALVALVGIVGFLLAPGPVLAVGALFLVGLGATGWYPIGQAAAYDTQPGSPGLVRAIGTLGTPFEVALPGIVGFLAGSFGLSVGIGFLGLAPVLVLLALPWRDLRTAPKESTGIEP